MGCVRQVRAGARVAVSSAHRWAGRVSSPAWFGQGRESGLSTSAWEENRYENASGELCRAGNVARRRGGHGGESPIEAPTFCGLQVDASSGAVYHQGQALELAPREAALLRALLARPGQAVAKERLFELVFAGEVDVQADAIEVVAYRLRKRLAATPARLVTLRGLGYLLKADA